MPLISSSDDGQDTGHAVMSHLSAINPPVVEKLTEVFMRTVSETHATPADGLQAIVNLIVLLLANLGAEERKLTVKRMKIGLPELAAEAGRLCAEAGNVRH